MKRKLNVLRRITAIILCVTLLSSQVVVANAEDSEKMDVQTRNEITNISEQDGFSSDAWDILIFQSLMLSFRASGRRRELSRSIIRTPGTGECQDLH